MAGVSSLAPSAARTTAGQGSAVQVDGATVSVHVDVTAVSGTSPSLALSLEWSNDGTTWATGDPADTLTALTAAGRRVKSFAARGAYVRLAWAITGTTPSFTFSASAYGV